MFDSFSPHSKVWIFQSERRLNSSEKHQISEALHSFIHSWHSHGEPLSGAYEIYFDQIIVLAVNELAGLPSGCSIDKAVKFISEVGATLHLDLLNRNIAVKLADKIELYTLQTFREYVKAGKFSGDTLLFNHAVSTLAEWRENWETPLKNSWAAKWLPLPKPLEATI